MASAEQSGGFAMHWFVEFVLETWAWHGEATSLVWAGVKLGDERSVHFRSTKSHEDRYVPLNGRTGIVETLPRVGARTLQQAGPFTYLAERSSLHKRWGLIGKSAQSEHITIEDLRRTGITWPLLDNVPATVVNDLAGHRKIETTMRYYKGIKKRDLRDAVRRRKRVAG